MAMHRQRRGSRHGSQKPVLLVTVALLAFAIQTYCKPLTAMVTPHGTALRSGSTTPAANATTAGSDVSLAYAGTTKQSGVVGPPGLIQTGAKPSTAGENDTYCLTATSLKADDEAEPVGLAKCDAKAQGQAWQLRFSGALAVGGTDKCLDAGKAELKSRVLVADCDATSMGQKWFLDGLRRLHPYATPDLCVDVAAAAAASPSMAYDAQSAFILYKCSTKLSQFFQAAALYPVELRATHQRIGLRANQFCLDTYDYQTGKEIAKRPAIVAECGANLPTQSWTYSVDSGYLANSGLAPTNTYCLQAANSSVGSPVQVVKCGLTANTLPKTLKDSQRWFRDAFLRFRSYSAPELCVEVFRDSALPESFNGDVAVDPNDLVLALNGCRASKAQQWLGEQPRPSSGSKKGAAKQAGAGAAANSTQAAAQPASAATQP